MSSDIKQPHPGEQPLKNAKREAFCQEYLVDKNQTAAAKRAGYSAKTAEQLGYQLLQESSVRDRIDFLLLAAQERTQITVDRVLEELGHVAFLDLGELYDEMGNLLNVKDMPEKARRALAGIKVFEEFEGFGEAREKVGEVREVKTSSKVDALRTLLQHLKPPVQKHEHSGPDGKPIEVKDASLLSDAEIDNQLQKYLKKLGIKTTKGKA
jgi:phage terminase small subunit